VGGESVDATRNPRGSEGLLPFPRILLRVTIHVERVPGRSPGPGLSADSFILE
jgi:hypothetical protein